MHRQRLGTPYQRLRETLKKRGKKKKYLKKGKKITNTKNSGQTSLNIPY